MNGRCVGLRRSRTNRQYDGKLRLATRFKAMVDRLEAGEDIETDLVDEDGERLAWHSVDVDDYLTAA